MRREYTVVREAWRGYGTPLNPCLVLVDWMAAGWQACEIKLDGGDVVAVLARQVAEEGDAKPGGIAFIPTSVPDIMSAILHSVSARCNDPTCTACNPVKQ